jgi:uncharacterized protein YlxW (UPF0749 family)
MQALPKRECDAGHSHALGVQADALAHTRNVAEVKAVMSLQDELTMAQRRVDELCRVVSRLEQQVGNSLDMRRVRADAEHLRDGLAQLRESAPDAVAGRPEMVTIPDAPYDPKLWSGAEDEGLGSPYGHAP